jgi:hypothetical protein
VALSGVGRRQMPLLGLKSMVNKAN